MLTTQQYPTWTTPRDNQPQHQGKLLTTNPSTRDSAEQPIPTPETVLNNQPQTRESTKQPTPAQESAKQPTLAP
jgi:hypothetical protein